MLISKSAKGMIAELKAIKLLTKQGYWCARSLDPQSPFDIVAVDKKGKVRLIDVKVNSYRKANNWRINRSQSKKQKELKIEIMMIDYEIQDFKNIKGKKRGKKNQGETRLMDAFSFPFFNGIIIYSGLVWSS